MSQEHWGSARAKTSKLAGAKTITRPDMRPRMEHYVNPAPTGPARRGPAVTPTPAQTPAEHHYQQAERTLATLGSLAATPEEATRAPARSSPLCAETGASAASSPDGRHQAAGTHP